MVKTPGGHTITFSSDFNKFTLLGQSVICDFVDMFFLYDDQNSTWHFQLTDKSDFRGQHIYNPNTRVHTITFNEKNIRRTYDKGHRKFGGNRKLQNIDMKMAAAFVLAHELQHANQSKLHKANESFYGYLGGFTKKGKPRMQQYKNRACEKDARKFVDEHTEEIFAYFNVEVKHKVKTKVADDSGELDAVANLLLECKTISLDDIRDELRASRILNPRNVQRVLEVMRDRGISLT